MGPPNIMCYVRQVRERGIVAVERAGTPSPPLPNTWNFLRDIVYNISAFCNPFGHQILNLRSMMRQILALVPDLFFACLEVAWIASELLARFGASPEVPKQKNRNHKEGVMDVGGSIGKAFALLEASLNRFTALPHTLSSYTATAAETLTGPRLPSDRSD